MKKLIRNFILNAVALYAVSRLIGGIYFANIEAVAMTGIVITLLNLIVKPILKVLSFPITLLTLGLFSFVVNGAVLFMAMQLTSGSYIRGMGSAIIASIVLSLINGVLEKVFD